MGEVGLIDRPSRVGYLSRSAALTNFTVSDSSIYKHNPSTQGMQVQLPARKGDSTRINDRIDRQRRIEIQLTSPSNAEPMWESKLALDRRGRVCRGASPRRRARKPQRPTTPGVPSLCRSDAGNPPSTR